MGPEDLFGASTNAFIFIALFWIMVGIFVCTITGLDEGPVGFAAAFIILGNTYLIGRFGWQILVIPALVIIGGAGFLIWKRISRF